MEKKWLIRSTSKDIKALAKKSGVSEVLAKILINRGFNNEIDIKKFMRASLEDLYDPFLMKDMEKAIELIKLAIENKKKIVVYGDYDADGVTSTVIMYKSLKQCGAAVEYYVPDRELEGYGINSDRIRKLSLEGFEVILTCDNGIAAMQQVKLAKELGMTVIITDHHELSFEEDSTGHRTFSIPQADAVINPKQKECNYPFKQLCGAGIALKFVQALYLKLGINSEAVKEFIEIAGIGTICDVVDLIDENRIIAKNALGMLTNTKNIGLKCLKEILSIEGKAIKSYHVGFQIGPCINATGRLESAAISVELLICEEQTRAVELAKTLYELNKKRQDMTTENVQQVIELVQHSPFKNDKVLVIYKDTIHESIAGIVAGRVRETFNVPTIILTSGKESPKGSARSIEEYNLFEELIKCEELLLKFGGHPMAAGLSIKEENIEKLRLKLNSICKLTDEDIIPKVRIDERMPLNKINYGIIEELELLEPYGKGNSSPLLAEKNIPVLKIDILGKSANTIKIKFLIPGTNKTIDGIFFNRVEEFMEMLKDSYGEEYKTYLDTPRGMKLDLIFSPQINEYNGYKSIQLKVIEFKLS
ncbi:single-stranded-DNA-specific exonuclease RecJ [Clostridium tagluense]|uniref:single-stranded-DNA-specific exonuclease RecJ n=1 Tax=Clostridium tagluense TaxID=360422 RepID=UPI001CF31B58|nr:single-stranded-DNA-specific exonuclease RecJ [Clostridium tagluense]MCB2310068.1 single-stranded-DNA-specific exonuclease RecJ [Clostridium tagluense]MCB2314402.1 single-stranded-DNA-specific exonuclease RecJ [Clostridium tagluense]MCB2319248.1 single-stranded-DNA-specific exonuclease RecJ [Clostridium tagluense]MCB2324662.1 single-stranded-DNA-specific exonuclease RecJ [Clostridium tagluense]MCB2329513.1 single-stranded-DNA-specific exonuclease RecJ [Clostridium tagluense]